METIEIEVKNLLPLPRNSKIHTAEQIENIKNSIKTFGFNDPLAIWQDCSNENEIILDLFGGSGSTMVASHQTNRLCYMSELDEKYLNVIIRRMLKADETLRVISDSEDVTEVFRIKN